MTHRQAAVWALVGGLAWGLAATAAHAEGSKEITSSGGDRGYLEYRNDVTQGSSILRRTIIYAYANAGEQISLGSSASGIGQGAIRWYAPDGTVGTNTSTTVGRISNRAQEVAGPLPNSGGYTPTNLTVGAAQTGVWEIHFVSPDPNSTANPTAQGVGVAWAQPNNVGYVSAWDVTVRAGGAAIPGRVYATQIAMNMGDFAAVLQPQVYFLTRDGYLYQVALNGIQPYGFNFFANNRGFLNGSGQPLFASVALAGSSVHDPLAADTATDTTHKLFFNQPAADLPSSANTHNGTTWLVTTPQTVTVSTMRFVGLDGTTNQVGSAVGGTFFFQATGPGTYQITIDLNGDGAYTSAVDRVLIGPTVAGQNSVFWDGRDGQGNPAPRSGSPSHFSSQVAAANGEVHFPFLDVENAVNGVTIQRLNGPATGRSTVFWNDAALGGTQALPPTGADSTGGTHKWSGDFGNNNGVDTWVWVPGNFLDLGSQVVIKQTDLEVVSKTRTPVVLPPGSNVTYAVVLRNNGPDAVALGRLIEQFPPALTNATLVSSLFSAGGAIVSAAFSNNTYDARLSMAVGETSTFTFSGAVAAGLGSTLTNVAKFLTYNDVGDIDDPLRTGAGNNSKSNVVAITFGVIGTVYNDGNVNATRDSGENGTGLTLYAKLIPTNAPSAAVQAAAVDPGTGDYALTTTVPGGYLVILSGNSTLTDVTPTLPAGWLGTEAPGQIRTGISVSTNTVTGQNFGLYNGSYYLIGKSANPAALNVAGTTTFSLTVTNSSSISNSLTAFVDSLPNRPTNLTYVAGSSLFNGVAIADPVITSGTNLTWSGNFSVPGSSARALTFRALVPGTSGAYTNHAFGRVGNTLIDTTANTADNLPAQTVVLVTNLVADLVATKTGPVTVLAGSNVVYAITVTNLGPSAATNIMVTDTLPTNSVFVVATGGGANANGVVGWPMFSLASGAVSNLSVTITAPPQGILTNQIAVTSPLLDPVPANNTNQWLTTVTPQADLRLTKTGPASLTAGANATYTLAVTNAGPSMATAVVLTDALPTNTVFVSASGGGVNTSGTVSWPAFDLVAGSASNFTVVATASVAGILTNNAQVTSAVADPAPGNNAAIAITTVTLASLPGGISGTVYLDANHNAQRDAGENGTGLSLFAKLIGAVTNATAVDASSGGYSFTNLPAGAYTVLISTNSNLADLAASVPAGWIGTEAPSQTRPNVVVSGSDVPNQNFGLCHGARLGGRVFADTGAGGGTANDGVLNGGEPGLPGVTVRLTDATGAIVYDTAVTDGAGNYSLVVPASAGGFRVVETNLTGCVSTGASVGNTGGAYTRATDTITFTNVVGTPYNGVNFGDVPANGWLPDNQQTALPGSVVFYAHTFQAGSAGTVTFSASHAANPSAPAWNEVLFLDANCNAVLDTNEVAVTAPIAVSAGQVICLLVKEVVPANAPLNGQNLATVTAAFSYTGSVPALAATNTVTDLTTVGAGNGAGLTLTKTADKPTALPGDLITYSIIYSNNSSGSLTNIFITDATPPYTTFVGASAPVLPLNLTGFNITAPASNSTGSITWQFSGSLAPAAGGAVTFKVKVAQ